MIKYSSIVKWNQHTIEMKSYFSHWYSFPLAKLITKLPAIVMRSVLALATLGDASQIEMILICVMSPIVN